MQPLTIEIIFDLHSLTCEIHNIKDIDCKPISIFFSYCSY